MSLAILTLATTSALSQAPERMSFQAVIRDANNALVENQNIGMRISILQGSPDGTTAYSELHNLSSNANALVSLEIGGGIVLEGDFSTIPWANGPYFIQTETDPLGGTNYNITGTTQILSVPYAMHAKTADQLANPAEETDPVFDDSPASGISNEDISGWNNKLDTEVDPSFNSSAAGTISNEDIESWNNKLDSFTETDPDFEAAPASGITNEDIDSWNNKLEDFTEADPQFEASPAAGIQGSDIDSWNNKLDAELDGDSTNELQELSVNGDTLFISNGNYIVLPGLSYLSDLQPGPSVQQRLDEGETPLDIYNSDNALLDSLYGAVYAGGHIFYFDASDGSGMVCTQADQTPNMHWYNCVYTNTGATLTEIGTGEINTTWIIADQGFGFYAASVCDMAEDGGFEDWFLPSKEELETMHANLHANGKGGFTDEVFWSSSEVDSNNAWSVDFSMGTSSILGKFFPHNVRAVRNFE